MNNCIILGICLYCLCQNSRNGNNGDGNWGCGGNRNGRSGNGNWDWNDGGSGRSGNNDNDCGCNGNGNGRGGRGNDNDGCDCVEPRFEPRFDARPFGGNRETRSCEEKSEQE